MNLDTSLYYQYGFDDTDCLTIVRSYKRSTLLVSKTFGQLLREIREEKGLSQDELAKLTHLSQMTISHTERDIGHPSDKTFRCLIEGLQLDRNAIHRLWSTPRDARDNRTSHRSKHNNLSLLQFQSLSKTTYALLIHTLDIQHQCLYDKDITLSEKRKDYIYTLFEPLYRQWWDLDLPSFSIKPIFYQRYREDLTDLVKQIIGSYLPSGFMAYLADLLIYHSVKYSFHLKD